LIKIIKKETFFGYPIDSESREHSQYQLELQ